MFYIRCIEEIFKTQRTLCSLLRPSLELLSVQTSANRCLGELEYTGHTSFTVKNNGSVGYRLDTLDAASAQSASCKLKQLTSMCHICEC